MVSWPRAGVPFKVGGMERLFAPTVQGIRFFWTVDAESRVDAILLAWGHDLPYMGTDGVAGA